VYTHNILFPLTKGKTLVIFSLLVIIIASEVIHFDGLPQDGRNARTTTESAAVRASETRGDGLRIAPVARGIYF